MKGLMNMLLISLVLMLVALSGTALAAIGYTLEYDLDGDGTAETLTLYRADGTTEDGWSGMLVCLEACSADGSVLADGEIYRFSDLGSASQRYILHNLGDGRIFVHALYSFEGTMSNYMIYRIEDGAWVQEINIEDPDYSDAAGLRYGYTGEDIYFSESYDDRVGPEFMAALEQSFADWSIPFASRGGIAYADLPGKQLICDVNGAFLLPGASMPLLDTP